MRLRQLRLRPHADRLFHMSYEQIVGHKISIRTPYVRFTRREDKTEAKNQTRECRALWKLIMTSNENSVLVRRLNLKLFTLFNVFHSKFFLSPVNEQ